MARDGIGTIRWDQRRKYYIVDVYINGERRRPDSARRPPPITCPCLRYSRTCFGSTDSLVLGFASSSESAALDRSP